MGHKKLVKFQAIEGYSNVLQYPEGMVGKWNGLFGNSNPITLELACGKGEYSVGLGRQNPNRNYIGVDIKGNRIYRGAKTALDERLGNVAFLRTQIDKITRYFGPNEVSEIWIVFADPFLKKPSNRLTHARFLYLYSRILAPGGIIRLKTDSPDLFYSTLEVIEEQHCTIHEKIEDIYKDGMPEGPLSIQTYYEGLHLADGRTIYYVAFSLPEGEIKLPARFERKFQELFGADDEVQSDES